MDEKQLAKLIRKNAAKAAKATKLRPASAYDSTLRTTKEHDDTDEERTRFFKEMKRREF